jgi:uncharacterized membrane protein
MKGGELIMNYEKTEDKPRKILVKILALVLTIAVLGFTAVRIYHQHVQAKREADEYNTQASNNDQEAAQEAFESGEWVKEDSIKVGHIGG